MTYEGFLRIGGVEVVNTERARGYTRTSDCPDYVVSDEVRCDALADAVGDAPYTYNAISQAPWYDPSLADLSARFMGVVGLKIEGASTSTRSSSRTEGVTNGGVNGRTRKGMRPLRVEVTLLAKGADALDYGTEWLSAVFDGGCGQHGDACSMTDTEFLAACPPERGTVVEDGETRPRTDAEYAELVNPLRRFLHDVTVSSGPIPIQEIDFDAGVVGRKLEFTISSERAWVYGIKKPLVLTPSLPSVVQDTPYNLLPYPSAELASGTIVTATNYSVNPGVEVNDTSWTGTSAAVTGTAPEPFISRGRSTDIGAGGSAASYRSRLLGNNGSTAVAGARSTMTVSQTMSIPLLPGQKCSISMWSACLILNGTAPGTEIVEVEVFAQFRHNINGNTGNPISLGKATGAELQGKVFQVSGLARPAGLVNQVQIYARATVIWSSSATASVNSDIRLYADALMVSVP